MDHALGLVTSARSFAQSVRRFGSWCRANSLAIFFLVALTGAYSALAIRRHLTFNTGGWDLGIFEQAIRHYSTFSAPISLLKGPNFNLLGDHFHPILMLLAPFYAMAPTPLTLLLAQALLFAVASWPLVSWARVSLGRAMAITVGVIYGLSFGIASAAGFDFHEIAFAVPLIAFSVTALGRGKLAHAAAWALPLVLVKEDLGLSVVAVVGFVIFLRGRRRLGIAVGLVGIAASALEILVILPSLNPGDAYDYWSKVSGQPLVQTLFTDAGVKGITVLLTIAITGFLALRSPLALIAAPTLLWRFLAQNPNYWGTDYHYSAVLMPILVAAMIDGAIKIRASHRVHARLLVRAGVAAALTVTALLVPFYPLSELTQSWLWEPNPRESAITAALGEIPSGSTVSATDNLIPQLTDRANVTLFGLRPLATDNPAWIIVDPFSSRRFTIDKDQEHHDLLAAERDGYRVVFSRDTITVLSRPVDAGVRHIS